MPLGRAYAAAEPRREDLDALPGPTLVEFGSPWCGYCRSVEPLLETELAAHPEVRHVKIEDGSGKPLGRSFGVRLWPTLVFLRDGRELTRLVRPRERAPIARALAMIDALDEGQAPDESDHHGA
jgi:thioredoxin 1